MWLSQIKVATNWTQVSNPYTSFAIATNDMLHMSVQLISLHIASE
jgi:hypothetical protein